MRAASVKPVRCAIYTRVSTEHGLDQEFNSLDAQYDAASAYIKSQAHAGWTLIRSRYDDGGYSGGSTDRPDLQKLLDDIRARKIDVIVVYKVDRLTRSLADFAKLVELFDAHGISWLASRGDAASSSRLPVTRIGPSVIICADPALNGSPSMGSYRSGDPSKHGKLRPSERQTKHL
jgi:hypothetical protein